LLNTNKSLLNTNKGFTLIELLVVISIIGLLAAAGLAVFTSAQKRARDATRVSHMKDLQSALAQYYLAENTYPTTSGGLSSNCVERDTHGVSHIEDILSPLVTEGYIQKIPSDPKGNPLSVWPYCYYYQYPSSYLHCSGATNRDYLMIFTTESTNYDGFIEYGIQGELGSKARYCMYNI